MAILAMRLCGLVDINQLIINPKLMNLFLYFLHHQVSQLFYQAPIIKLMSSPHVLHQEIRILVKTKATKRHSAGCGRDLLSRNGSPIGAQLDGCNSFDTLLKLGFEGRAQRFLPDLVNEQVRKNKESF